MGEEKKPRTVKVVDRRRFTTDGEPKDDDLCAEDSSANPPSDSSDAGEPEPVPRTSPPTPPEGATPAPEKGANETSPEFVELVVMLAQQAELLLVGAEGLPAQPAEARRLIDCLGSLEAKTSGNLSPEETKVLADLLFQLRTVFVQSPQ